MAQDSKHETGRVARIAGIALKVVGIVIGVLALAVGGLMIVLQTRWGGERLRRQVVTRANQQIQGQLAIGRLAFGGDRVTVWDVTLRDPDGQLVAQVGRAEVDLRLTRLLHKEVRVSAVEIDSPRVMAVSDARGSNLSRAVAPRKKAPPKPPAKPRTREEGWVIQLDRFQLKDGDIALASAGPTNRKESVHFANLQSFLSARYATGNGSTDMTFRLQGQSLLAPVGPLALDATLTARGDATSFALHGKVLGGTIEARGDVDSGHLDATRALVAVAIPRTALAGFDWGPLTIDALAAPGALPKVNLALSIPGLELTVKDGGPDAFKLETRLAVADLALTARAVQALTTAVVPALAGHGDLRVTVEGPFARGPAGWSAGIKGLFDHLRFADNAITGLSVDGQVARLSASPGEASLRVAIASVAAGTTKLAKIQLDAKVHAQDITAQASLASPEPVSLSLAGRLDDDQQGLALSRIGLTYPRAEWISQGVAKLDFGGQTLSLKGLVLRSQGQQLALDGSKDGDQIDAHLALEDLRLDLLPALVVDPGMNLGGNLDVDVKADGETEDPRVTARVRLERGRFRGFSKINATVDATLAHQQVDGKLGIEAPFAAVDGTFQLPQDPLAPGGALDLKVDVTRLNLAEALRGAAIEPQVDGRLTAQLRVTGKASDPRVALTINGRELEVKRPASRTVAASAVDVGHARIHLTYEDRAAHADVDFASAHGGLLRADAAARIDLSYPAVSHPIVVKKLPVHGKVVAKDFDVGWISRFNPRIETLGGQVNANAKLAGTVGDPQFIGDVRWKNGKVVATVNPKNAPKSAP